MYGKHFSSMYEGSMMGAGPVVFAVWGYVISKAVAEQVELNPRLMAVLIGCETREIESAIEYLCRPDENSRNSDEDGRRLVKVGQFAYRVVSHKIYNSIRHEDDRREYNRKKQAEYRAAKRVESVPACTGVYRGVPQSAHTEEDTDADTEAEADTNTEEEGKTKSKKTKCDDFQKPDDVQQGTWVDWLAVRKQKKAGPVTNTVMSLLGKQAKIAGYTLEQAIEMAAGSNWITFKAEYIKQSNGNGKGPVTFAQQREINSRSAREQWLEEMKSKGPDNWLPAGFIKGEMTFEND
jgi:hypothetical protein